MSEQFAGLDRSIQGNAPLTSALVEIEGYINDRQAAEFLGLKPRTVHKYTKLGLLPSFKIAGTRRYRRSELARAMESFRESSRAEVLR